MLQPRNLAIWFLAGFGGTIFGHQPVLALLEAANVATFPAFQVGPVPPFGVPQMLSLAFWGGIWGMILGVVARHFGTGLRYWIWVALFGAVAPVIVAVVVVFPLKDVQPAGDPVSSLITGLLVNAAWGLMTAFIRRLIRA